jgi:hypothetical protein
MKNKPEKRKTKKVLFNSKIVECVTVGELATMCDYATITIKKMEERGIMPQPNIRGKAMKNGELGKRLYSVKLAEALVPILAQIVNGVKVSDETKRQIAVAFQNEKQFLNTPG